MANPLLLPEIRAMLAQGDVEGLSSLMTEIHPASTAEFIDELTTDEIWEVFAHAPIENQAAVFQFLPIERQVELVSGAGRERISRLLEKMSHDDRADLVKELDDAVVESLLPLVAKADREDIRRLLTYPEDSAGSVMTTDYATLPPDVTVEEAIRRLRQQADQRETIYYVYVVDSQRRLIGFVSLRDLILARPKARIEDIMNRDLVSVRVDDDQEEVAKTLAKFDFLAIPVVDSEEKLVGIVTFDDLADIVEEEATEDFHRVGAVAPLEKGYAENSVWDLYSKRIGWLVALVLVSLMSSGVIAAYEETLQEIIALAFFLPLLMGSGGNTGAQAATLAVRALATEELQLSEWLKTGRRELIVGVTLGATMAAASFLLGLFRGGFQVGLIVGLAMFCIIVFTNLLGVLLPFVLTKVKIDPAVASSPLITTVADATGLLIYFNIAAWLMRFFKQASESGISP